jgi:Asp-tRNA(Asn)/Glu-tRNA(Gln) amidotransferase A subunit family amidase
VRQILKVVFLIAGLLTAAHAASRQVELMEASISDIHRAMRDGKLTCRTLVQSYLDRIQAYDKQGPALNAMLDVNPKALEQADALDREFKRTGKLKPLQCIPVVLKDIFDTADMPTTGASLSLKGAQPVKDAFTVTRFRQAGALILAKTNMHEFALAGVTASSLGGQTKNPYDLTRTPGGSSGGTGAALAANFAVTGTGTDTVNSIRSPASANSLVGFRPTRGLISRAGIIPVSFTQDAAGPLARSVADAAVMLDVMAGYDPDDPVTAFSIGNIPNSYTAFLEKNRLQGVRIGVLRTLFGNGPDYEPVNRVMAQAIEALKNQGATVVELENGHFDTGMLARDLDVQKYEYKSQINGYLQQQDGHVPVHSLAEILASGNYHKPSLDSFLKSAESYQNGLQEPDYKDRRLKIEALKIELADFMAKNNVEVLAYPHQKRLPVLIGDMNQADRNGILASLAGFPAVTVPAGFSAPTPDAPVGVPVGIEFLGRPWSEPQLIKIAYGFEQATHARKPPASTPPLKGK